MSTVRRVAGLLGHLVPAPVDSDDEREIKVWTRAMIQEATDDGLCVIVIHNKVYEITEFLPEHPGKLALIF
jgi:cytochrome b involved in lipid metabolism